jgi:hypothetical protein
MAARIRATLRPLADDYALPHTDAGKSGRGNVAAVGSNSQWAASNALLSYPAHGSGGIGGDNQEPIGFFGDQEKGAEPICGGRAINAGG